MSSRNRQSRNPNRNSSSSTQGEEAQLWSLIKDEIRELVDSINNSNDQIRAILAQDALIAQSLEASKEKSEAGEEPDMAALEHAFDTLIRAGVGGADLSKQKLSDVIEHVTVLRALTKAREESEGVVHSSHGVGTPGPHSSSAGRDRNSSSLLGSGGRSSSGRGHGGKGGDRGGDREGRDTRDRDRGEKEKEKGDKEGKDRDRNSERLGDKLAADKSERGDKHSDRDLSSMYDFDGAGDSPAPSPLSSHTRKLGANNTTAGSDRASTAARDSVPPRDTPSKDSVPPEPNTSISTSNGTTTSAPTTAGATQRSKVTFHKGQDVVFKPKPSRDHESTEWMLGRVQQVLGEGKSRRYRVQDADPDLDPDQRAEYRTSASSMIPVPAAGEKEKKLPKLDKGKTVLALYPDSTTFYKAEVMGVEAEGEGEGKERVKLRFEGEETSGTLQLVERRFVVEYRA
ncbi:SGF29 tudor-like domain-containing protein [Copromyces sp. CBS 386.78]|nr:SGF29 tudor-like domain-containing protein [Copromyces sp. CBS 386.78]